MYDLHFQQSVCSLPGSYNHGAASSQLSLFIVLPSCGGLLKSQLRSVQQVAAFHLFLSKVSFHSKRTVSAIHAAFSLFCFVFLLLVLYIFFVVPPTVRTIMCLAAIKLSKVSTLSIFHGRYQPNKLNLIYWLILMRGFQIPSEPSLHQYRTEL